MMPAAIIEDWVVTWIDLHESPPLWIFVAATFIVAAHDVKWFEGIAFLRRTDNKVFRALLILIAIGMSYAMEVSVNVHVSHQPFYYQSLLFQIPSNIFIEEQIRIGYHLIRLCRLVLMFNFFLALIEKDPKKVRLKAKDAIQTAE